MRLLSVVCCVLPVICASCGSASSSRDAGAAEDAGAGDAGSDAPGDAGMPDAAVETASNEVFIGPFPSWANVRADYGAVGDGETDDTAAIQSALDDLGQPGQKTVLFFPAGTYRITDTLTLFKTSGVAILGEDPATTKLVWAGPRNDSADLQSNTGVMLLVQGSTGARVGRLTFDGASVANWAIRLRWGSYGSGEFFPSANELHDLVIENADIGIGAGYYDGVSPQDTAEYSRVIRTTFRNCAQAGLQVAEFNCLLWGVLDSRFEDNGVGVDNLYGNANVYDSVFARSREVDIRAGTVPFVSARGNYSAGSRSFFSFTGNTGTATLQNNTIVDAQDTPIAGGLCCGHPRINVLGNTIDTGSAKAVELNVYASLLSAGNRLSADDWVTPGEGGHRSLDDRPGQTLAPVEPMLPPTPARFAGPIVTVAALTGEAIQLAIDEAVARYPDEETVVYVPTGYYQVATTIHVPAGANLHLVGDGSSSHLAWTGEAGGVVLQLDGPSHARVQDLVTSGPTADNLVITNADQQGGSVVLRGFSNIPWNDSTTVHGLSVEGLDQTTVELLLPHYMGGSLGAVRVTGGPSAQPLSQGPANVRYVGGYPYVGDAATGPVFSFQVSDGGRLIAEDVWSETINVHVVEPVGSAGVTLSNASFGMGSLVDEPATIEASDFAGRLTLVGVLLGFAHVASRGDNADQNVLVASSLLGGWQGTDDGSRYHQLATAGTTKGLLIWGEAVPESGPPNDDDVDDAWLRAMLGPLLADRSLRLEPPKAGTTNVRLIRYGSITAATAVRVVR